MLGVEPAVPGAADLQSAGVTNFLTSPNFLVPRTGVEPILANYLLHTGYKSAVLPLNYRGINLGL